MFERMQQNRKSKREWCLADLASEFLGGLREPEVPVGVGHCLYQVECVARADVAIGDGDADDVDGLAGGDALELRVAQGFPVI